MDDHHHIEEERNDFVGEEEKEEQKGEADEIGLGLRTLKKETESQLKKLRGLNESYQMLKDPLMSKIVDQDDLNLIKNEFESCATRFKSLVEKVQQMEQCRSLLQQRQELLDHIDAKTHVFQQHPHLLNKFAEKQVQLQNCLLNKF